MNCQTCGKNFTCIKKYILHIEYLHNLNNYYKCPFHKCDRLYNRRDIFKRHIAAKHILKKNITVKKHTKVVDESDPSSTLQAKHTLMSHENKVSSPIDNTGRNIVETFNIKNLLTQFSELLEKTVAQFIAQLYNHIAITRTVIQWIINLIQSFLSSGLLDLIKRCCSNIPKVTEHSSDILDAVFHMFHSFENAFQSLNTEYKRMKYFEKSQCLLNPVLRVIGVAEEQKNNNRETVMVLKNHCSYFVPLSKTLKLFFEISGVFKIVFDYQNALMTSENTAIINLVHGRLWRKIIKTFPNNQIVFPLIIYFDDFEPLNPLGSHATCYKIGAVYFSLPTIPPEFASRLENVFLSLLFYSGDRQKFGNRKTFQPLIDDLLLLETIGLNINVKDQVFNVKFCVVLVTGDNLGVHSILGLNESFSSNYFCRFCTVTKLESKKMYTENALIIRRTDQYQEHLENKIGVKEPCIWNDLPSFHIYENICCDIMHDIYEGILRYDMALIIQKLIQEKKFTLERLNSRIKYCCYDNTEKNICPGINKDHLSKKYIVMSAAEMICLTKNFSYIIGDLVPEENEVWKFYLIVAELVHILMSTAFTKSTLDLLSSVIYNHNESYKKLSGNDLKPKFHILTHYPRIINEVGPLILLSCMRFESKHKDFKIISQRSSCRKNLPLTFGLRNQLKFCYRLMSSEGFQDRISYGKVEDVTVTPEMQRLFQSSHKNIHDFFITSWYELNGTKYEVGCILLCNVENDIPEYGRIKDIFVNNSNFKDIYFFCVPLIIRSYNEHLYAYEVEISYDCKMFSYDSLFSKDPSIIHKVGNKSYISILMG